VHILRLQRPSSLTLEIVKENRVILASNSIDVDPETRGLDCASVGDDLESLDRDSASLT
jgi:hypothetical protein